MQSRQEAVQKIIHDAHDHDHDLGKEIDDHIMQAMADGKDKKPGITNVIDAPQEILETIVLQVGRPVLDVINEKAVIELDNTDSNVWEKRLKNAQPKLKVAIPAVGRIELRNHPNPRIHWVGTGWLLSENIIVTNRHVAEVFARESGSGFTFRIGADGTSMLGNIDFIEEFENPNSEEFNFKIIHVERDSGPDLAFLRVEPIDGRTLPEPIKLSNQPAQSSDRVAVIGYPAKDPDFPDQALMKKIFKDRYDKKRLAPGEIISQSNGRVFHDCSTLGGNSGSAVISLDTGDAVALHFAGSLFQRNHAVSAEVVGNRFDDVLVGRVRRRRNQDSQRIVVSGAENRNTHPQNKITATIPIQVQIEIGTPTFGEPPSKIKDISIPPGNRDGSFFDDDIEEVTEARPEEYRDRKGFESNFLGSGFEVPLPQVTDDGDDILTFNFDGSEQSVLHYRHFSVLMSESRRLCRYSACNIDGRTSKKRKRKSWRFDPRIPKAAQIMKECYGPLPKFSRGHMTRRQDPVWGSNDDATTGNTDSMHVTNAVPQIQPFNGGIWLSLEDYALDNTREDKMRICVFTGPFLKDSDPVEYGVQIPLSFWKVIVFIHDRTNQLSATGYTMSQESFIEDREFVFGQHRNSQVSIASIELKSGLSFGKLADIDPLRDADESIFSELTSPSQIRFIR